MNDGKSEGETLAPHPLIGLDEIQPASETIDEETGLPYGKAIDEAAIALLEDRSISYRRLGGAVLATDGRMTTLDMETTGLGMDGPWQANNVYDEGFADTAVGASRLKPIRIAADDQRWTEILTAVGDADVPLAREDMEIEGERVIVLFDVSTPRDLDRLGRFVGLLREADLLRPDMVLVLEGFDKLDMMEREDTLRETSRVIDLGYDPIRALARTARFGRFRDVLAITGDCLAHMQSPDRLEDRIPRDLAEMGAMLEIDLVRYRKRSTYRLDPRSAHMHLGISALLPERSGFDHRRANAAPRSARSQRGKRR